MKRATAVVVLSVVLTSCATLGREIPRCDFPFIDIPISVVMQIQAIPGAEFGPCVNELAPGWTYHHMHHETGRVRFWLDSDRLGDRFLRVTMEESCDPGGAVARPHPIERIQLFVDATAEVEPVDIVIVPLSELAVDYAASVGVDLAGVSVNGRPFRLQLDVGPGTAQERIDEALQAGLIVIAVDLVDELDSTVQFAVPNSGAMVAGARLADFIDDIEESVEEGTYRASWYHLFAGGCVVFEFNAEGPGVERLVADVDAAVGFVDLANLSRLAAEAGIILDESELE